LSAELQMALEPLLRAIESLSQQILNYKPPPCVAWLT
jgi:hypothetical protein